MVYVEDGVVKGAPFDERTPRLTGDPVVIADGAFYFRPYGESDVSVSTTGTIVLVPPGSEEQLVWFDESGKRLGTIGPRGRFNGVRISPDGRRVAATLVDRRTSASDILVYGVDRPTTTRLTTDARWEGGPVWSPDGATIYFSWDRSDAPEVYSIGADGTGPITPIYGPGSGGGIWMVSDVHPDGRSLLVHGQVDRLGREIRVVPLGGSEQATTYRSTPANERDARVSPDGRWVAYTSDESGDPEVYLAAFAGGGPRVQISERAGGAIAWSPGSDRVYYVRSRSNAAEESTGASAMMAVDLATPEAFGSPPAPRVVFETPESIADFDITPDGKRFLLHLKPVDTPPIRVILNALPHR
jgi:Tol biopolymer transport system component